MGLCVNMLLLGWHFKGIQIQIKIRLLTFLCAALSQELLIQINSFEKGKISSFQFQRILVFQGFFNFQSKFGN